MGGRRNIGDISCARFVFFRNITRWNIRFTGKENKMKTCEDEFAKALRAVALIEQDDTPKHPFTLFGIETGYGDRKSVV
jgi:hypothetical protein